MTTKADTPRHILTPALAGTLTLLAIPLLAMLFTSAVNWAVGDFLVAGGLLFAALSTALWLVKHTSTPAYRAGALLAVAGLFLLVWGNAAVGLTDTPADRFVWFVPLVTIAVAVGARFRPRGMALAMLTAWGVLAAIAVLGLLFAANPATGWGEVALIVGFFGGLLGGAAFCFYRAATTST